MASWAFELADNNFVPQGEILNAAARSVYIGKSRIPTLSFQVRLDHPLAGAMLTTNCYVKGYRRLAGTPWDLEFYGPIISAQATGDRDRSTVAVNCAGIGWNLQKRFAGKSQNGRQFTTATDRAQIAKTLIDEANAENETHITTSGATISAASGITYIAGPFKLISDCISELSSAFDGFDWMIDPVDNYSGGVVTSQKIGRFRAAPVLGELRSEAVYEWGIGRNNVSQFDLQVSRDVQADKVYHYTTSGPDAPGAPTVSAQDNNAITQWGLLEDVATDDILNTAMRQNLVNEHVAVRAQPRQVFSFTPHIDPYDSGRLPRYGVDWTVGDMVHARIGYGGSPLLDTVVRVHAVQFDINDMGIEQQTLTLVDEGG